jgi:hypothetical protein
MFRDRSTTTQTSSLPCPDLSNLCFPLDTLFLNNLGCSSHTVFFFSALVLAPFVTADCCENETTDGPVTGAGDVAWVVSVGERNEV